MYCADEALTAGGVASLYPAGSEFSRSTGFSVFAQPILSAAVYRSVTIRMNVFNCELPTSSALNPRFRYAIWPSTVTRLWSYSGAPELKLRRAAIGRVGMVLQALFEIVLDDPTQNTPDCLTRHVAKILPNTFISLAGFP